jgi:DNA-damage-inducible protein J
MQRRDGLRLAEGVVAVLGGDGAEGPGDERTVAGIAAQSEGAALCRCRDQQAVGVVAVVDRVGAAVRGAQRLRGGVEVRVLVEGERGIEGAGGGLGQRQRAGVGEGEGFAVCCCEAVDMARTVGGEGLHRGQVRPARERQRRGRRPRCGQGERAAAGDEQAAVGAEGEGVDGWWIDGWTVGRARGAGGASPRVWSRNWTRLQMLGLQCSYHSGEDHALSQNAVVRARIDEHIKEEASAVLATMGLTVSDAFRLLLIRIAREKALPFEPLVPNETTIAAMREARAGNVEGFDSVEALMADLHAKD